MPRLTDKQLSTLRVLDRACRRLSFVTARTVWEHGGSENIRAAGRLLASLARQGLVHIERSRHGQVSANRYSITDNGRRVLELWQREQVHV